MIIYKITNKTTGKCYIGQTTLPLSRRGERKSAGGYRWEYVT